jgi:hypothetical protein
MKNFDLNCGLQVQAASVSAASVAFGCRSAIACSQRFMKGSAVFFCALWILSQSTLGQTINTNYLRRDETLQHDEIALKFSAVCLPTAPPTRTLGLGLDRVSFLDSGSNVLFSIDVGTTLGSYYLGEGWYFREASGTNLTWCWANGLAPQSVIACPVPSGSRFVEFVCATPWTTACSPINTEVRVNGYFSGSFALPANSGWRTCIVPLPQQIPRHVDYALVEGGPITLSAIDWINADGAVVSSVPTLCSLSGAGSTASFAAAVPAGAGDFQLRLATPSPIQSRLRVAVNNSSALIVNIPAGSNWVSSAEPDAMERQADKRTRDEGWGEDFNARRSGVIWTWPNTRYTALDCDGDALKMPFVEGESSVQLTLSLPEALPIADFPYLSVKLRASKGALYFVRPVWYGDQNRYVPLWFDEAPTENCVGTGDWETLTVSLPRLIRMGGSPATMVSAIEFPLIQGNATNATLEIDWVRVHNGLLPNPEDRTLIETNFSNHLDDDGDGKTDKDDARDYQTNGFPKRLVLCYYHPWFGSRFGPSGNWLNWLGERIEFDFLGPTPPVRLGTVFDPDTFDPQYPGKRNTCSVYYPLNFRDYTEYTPPANGQYRYDLHGGLEQYDNRSGAYVSHEIALAQRYGIDGFVADTGGQGSWQLQIENLLSCSQAASKPFSISVLYDNYYRWPSYGLMTEKSDYSMAMDLVFFLNHYGGHPSWLKYGAKPVITAPFLSFTVAAEKWQRVQQICLEPESSSFDSTLSTGSRQPGYGNRLVFSFANTERPTVDGRDLSVRFDYIQLYDCNLTPLAIFDFGTTAMRSHLLSGWSNDESAPDGNTWVWAAGTQRVASAEIQLPAEARFMEIRCYSFPANNSVTMRLNGGSPLSAPVSQSPCSYYFRFADDGASPCPMRTARHFALFLDSTEAALDFDGFASYGSYLRSSYCIASDPQPTILTVACGYDDRKTRSPGTFTDRENGAFYRRQWESALAGMPDVVLVNTWNEWAEGTIIQPTVEFGYKYLELTLTYSLIFHAKLLTSVKPSAMELTVKQYDVNPDGQSEISLSATNQGTVVFTNILLDHLVSFQALRDGSPFAGYSLNPTNGTLALDLLNSAAEYHVTFVRDGFPPVGSVQINSGRAYTDSTNVLLSLKATDNRGIVAGMRISNDGVSWTGWESYATNKPWALTAGDGPKSVFVQFKDDVDNVATIAANITVGHCWFDAINRRSNGVIDLMFTGTMGGRYRIDSATNLGVWYPFLLVTNTSRTISVADQSATNEQRRFYRAVQQ